MLNVHRVISTRYPSFLEKTPKPIYRSFVGFLMKILHQKDINEFLKKHQNNNAFSFIEELFSFLDFDYYVGANQKINIPTSGRVVIIANHPLGALDSLALIQMVSEVRKDVKIVANDILLAFDPLKEILLPVDSMGKKTNKNAVKRIYSALENDEAVILFPAGEVSRAGLLGIKDGEWNDGFYRFASKLNAPILPIFIKAKNSWLFYTISSIFKPLSALLLVHEIFKKRSKSIQFTIGEIIDLHSAKLEGILPKSRTKLFRKHLLKIGKGKEGIIATQSPIAHPEARQIIRSELKKQELLGQTKDSKMIYLCGYSENSSLMREIGRLREVSFRKVGEGSGSKRDLDRYDKYYKHLVLWDDEMLEVVGSYRIGECDFISDKDDLYSSTLFAYTKEFEPYLVNSIELGRSFVQPKYWGSRALDYLWQGIGAYLKSRPNIRYMFGPVSISNTIVNAAKEQIVALYLKHFGEERCLVKAKIPFRVSPFKLLPDATKSYEEDFIDVKEQLACMNSAIPTLYKQYSDLCEEGGVKFLDFNIDPEFNHCVDGFILVDISKIKEKKRIRYMGN